MDAELPAGCGHYPEKQPGGHYQFRTFRTGTAPARFRCCEDRRRPDRGQNLRGRYSVRDARRRRAQAHGQRPDDLLGCETHVYCGRLRRVGFGRERYDNRRIHRERLFQPGLGAQDGQALRPEHRFFVPLRARRGSRHTGLCPQACRPADEGAGWRRDRLRNYGYLLRSYRKVQSGTRYKACQSSDRQRDSCRYDPHDSRCARH